MSGAAWSRLPAELKELPQWVIAGADKTPLSVDMNGKLYAASSVAPEQWLPYDVACNYAAHHSLGIGFMLHANDPFTCIDFDVKDSTNEPDPTKHTHPDAFHWFWEVAQRWDSYTETSRSGKGLHIWVRAKIGKGVRRHPIEIYSQERYIICTGNIVLDKPIRERQEFVMDLAAQMGAGGDKKVTELVEIPPVMEDAAIWRMARDAENSFNFSELCSGRWQQFGHPSQSEADLALMSMFTFYSKSNEQCRRMFRQTMLGQREKAQKNNRYLDFTLITIRSRQAKEVKVDMNAMMASADFALKERAAQMPTMHVPERATAVPEAPSTPVAVTLASPVPAAVAAQDSGLAWPPGFVGHLAYFIYQSAPRPVKEVAIVGAIGLMAGICGKSWYIPNSGLNLYMILIARSAIGKEAMHTGVSSLLRAAAKRAPTIYSFVDFGDFASGPALVKACAANTCFVNVTGEWGRKLKRLANDDGRDTAMASLRTVMTNLYQKSGPQSIVGGITYSNKDSNIAAVSGVSYSMIGETTPKTFYEALTETMMEDGFLSRFSIVEYTGERPELNRDPHVTPPEPLAQALGELAQQSFQLASQLGGGQPVSAAQETATILAAFEKECDKQINSAPEDESWRQMWNRAALKAMRIGALLAVGDNYLHPVVTAEHINWAIDLVRRDISIMQRKLETGEVGTDDVSRERKLIDILRQYVVTGPPEGYKVKKAMSDNHIVPQNYLAQRCIQLTTFKNHKLGAQEGMKQTVRNLCESGYLKEVQKDKLDEHYSYYGKAYLIVNLPDTHFRKRTA